MNSGIRFFIFVSIITPCLSYACIENTEQHRIFEYYARAALLEFCYKAVDRHCAQVNTELSYLEPEFYFFEEGSRREVLVVFPLTNSHPSVVLSYDKDGLLRVVDRGFSFEDIFELIKNFEEEGDFANPPDYFG